MGVIDQKKIKILVIGLDMGDGRLIRKWVDQGYLPALSGMMESGKWADLATPAEVLHVSAWPSLYTGTLPGKHGVYYTYQAARGQQNAKRIGIGQYGKPPIWKILDKAGKQCIVMDAPYTFPEDGYLGKQIFEWGTWGWYWHPMSIPEDLWTRLRSKIGPYPLGYEANQIGLGAINHKKLRNGLIKSAITKGKAVKWLLDEETWDFSWVVFGETHAAGHYLCQGDGLASGEADLCRDVYEAVDSAIEHIVAGMKDYVSIFVVSGDGVGENRAGWHLLPEILKKAGYLAISEPSAAETEESQQGNVKVKKDLLKRIRDMLPENFRQMISKKLPATMRDKLMSRWANVNIAWHNTRAYCLPTDLEGCIRINLRGREPEGIVEAGEEYHKVCEEITQLLSGLINPKTGQRVVKAIHKIDKVFPGERKDDLPDIVVQWSDTDEIDDVSLPGIWEVKGSSPDSRNGTHRPPGFVMASGRGISRGDFSGNCRVVDFAPSLLYVLGLEAPDYMDGKVWEELY